MAQEEYIPQWALNEKKAAEQKAAADQFDNGLRELMAAQKKLGIQKLNILTGEFGSDHMVAALVPAGAKKAVPYVLFNRTKNELKLVGDQIAPPSHRQPGDGLPLPAALVRRRIGPLFCRARTQRSSRFGA